MYTKHRICRYLRLTIKRNTTTASAIALAHCVFNGNILRNVLPAATILAHTSNRLNGTEWRMGTRKTLQKNPLPPQAPPLLMKLCKSPPNCLPRFVHPPHTHRSHAAVINCLKSTVPKPTPKCVRFTKNKKRRP